jgi:hypothetical protein
MPLTIRKKRKISESDIEPEKMPVKKKKSSGNDLLKTLSPDQSRGANLKEEDSESEVKLSSN